MRHGSRRGIGVVASLTLLLAITSGQLPSEAAEPNSAVTEVGPLPPSPVDEDGSSRTGGRIAAIDPVAKKMYFMYYATGGGQWHIVRYDTSKRIPQPENDKVIEAPLNGGLAISDRHAVRDSKRNRLLIAQPEEVKIIDLEAVQLADSWPMTVPHPSPQPHEPIYPGLDAQGITYDARDDRVYIVGETVAHFAMEQWSGYRPQAVTAVVALDAGTGKPIWRLIVPSCQQPLNTYSIGALIARSHKSNALYIPCTRSDTAQRVSGLSKIEMGPNGGVAGQAEAAQFPQRYFPIAGQYQSLRPLDGIQAEAVFDAGSDRVFLQSLSTLSPGSWVFDGRYEGWVGFIASPSPLPRIAINPLTGHFFASGLGGPMLIADGRGTPAPQGTIVDLHTAGYIQTDPTSNRFYLKLELLRAGKSKKLDYGWFVFEDNTLSEAELKPTDFDRLTHDIPESESTERTFAGGIAGYGSRLLFTGGWPGILRAFTFGSTGRFVRDLGTSSELGGFGVNDTGLHPRDRSLMMARVISLDTREAGSSATAQAVSPDSLSNDEWNQRSSTMRSSCDKTTSRMGQSSQPCSGAVNEQLDKTAKQIPEWPWDSATCLDSGGSSEAPKPAEGDGGYAEVLCSFDKQRTEASSSYGPFDMESTDQDDQGLKIASSFFEAKAWRDASLGTVSRAFARATGIRLKTEAGSVSIAEVSHEVMTTARGRPGTTKVESTRRLSGIVLRPASGNATYVDGCVNDDCVSVLRDMNRILGEALTVAMPSPDVTKSKKGAYAGYRKADGQYFSDLTTQNDDTRSVPALMVVFYDDAEEKSRVVVQMAAIEATSVYTISPAAEGLEPDPPISDGPFTNDGLGGGNAITPQDPNVSGNSGPSVLVPRSIGNGVSGITAFLIRSPVEAVQFASILLLLAGAVVSTMRRRMMKAYVDEGGTS